MGGARNLWTVLFFSSGFWVGRGVLVRGMGSRIRDVEDE